MRGCGRRSNNIKLQLLGARECNPINQPVTKLHLTAEPLRVNCFGLLLNPHISPVFLSLPSLPRFTFPSNYPGTHSALWSSSSRNLLCLLLRYSIAHQSPASQAVRQAPGPAPRGQRLTISCLPPLLRSPIISPSISPSYLHLHLSPTLRKDRWIPHDRG